MATHWHWEGGGEEWAKFVQGKSTFTFCNIVTVCEPEVVEFPSCSSVGFPTMRFLYWMKPHVVNQKNS